ncbi:MAG: DUF58 domain-containing protein [Acidobacteriota bacterium]|nr:DUF58 domain-containing protein [Acidobacteriota bacterium]
MSSPTIRVERIRITRAGIWFIVVSLIVGAAAANTGNNALYLVESMLLALLVVSGFMSRRNLRKLDIAFGAPPEVHATQHFSIPVTVTNNDRLFSRRFVLISGVEAVNPLLLTYLGPGVTHEDRLVFVFGKRGLHRVPFLRVSSVFPLGLFDKAMRYGAELEVLVFPQISPVSESRYFSRGRVGDELTKRAGWSHELRALRLFRSGDDPRSIHWKRSARTGDLIFMEREAEAGRRLTIFVDNAFGTLDAETEERFEAMVGEAASLAVHYLDQSFEVALTTRDEHIHYGRGRPQQLRILTSLALIESVPRQPFSLWRGKSGTTEVRLGPGEERIAS